MKKVPVLWVIAACTALLSGAMIALFLHGTFDAPDPQEQVGARWIKPAGSETAYAGNAACQACHPREFQRYTASPHARTVHLIRAGEARPEFGSTQTVADNLNGVLYSVRQEQGKNEVVATTASSSEPAVASWAMGSGTHAWTYLAQDGDKFTQLRITYYPPVRGWNFTPGSGPGQPFHQALGDPYTPAQAAACFGCHSTVLTGSPRSLDLAHSLLNVGCESCHGPCRRHVESMTGPGASATGTPTARDAVVTPPLHGGAESMQLCGSCHRMPVPVSDENGLGEAQLARFPGIALPRSRCFIASAGKLACVTCHDPHQSTVHQGLASFERKCISCHSAPHGTPCARGETGRCVTCHMPSQLIAAKLPLRFHNHWIRKDPSGLS